MNLTIKRAEELMESEQYEELVQLLSTDRCVGCITNFIKHWEKIPDELGEKYAQVYAHKAMIYGYNDEREKMNKYLSLLCEKQKKVPQNSEEYITIQAYITYINMSVVQPNRNRLSDVRRIVELVRKKKANVPAFSITLHRPTIINGIIDLTKYSERILSGDTRLEHAMEKAYGEKARGVFEMAQAEIMYQRNDIKGAEKKLKSIMGKISNRTDSSVLFTVLYRKMGIMLATKRYAELNTAADELYETIENRGAYHLIPNVRAVKALSSMYDRNYTYIDRWMEKEAPNEYNSFSILDLFKYFIKLRIYIMKKKYYSAIVLAEKIRQSMVQYGREKDKCEILMLLSVLYYLCGEKEKAFEIFEKSVEIGEKRKYYRLFSDEGVSMYKLTEEYSKKFGETEFLKKIKKLSLETGKIYPEYMNADVPKCNDLASEEEEVVRHMAEGKPDGDIAAAMNISFEEFKSCVRSINSKLGTHNRWQILIRACEIGLIEIRHVNLNQ